VIFISDSQERVVITKDNDFLESFLISKTPAKLIVVKTGNIRNSELLILFQNNLDKICSLLEDAALIEFSRDEIIVHM
jgi:predicted nuclease of predicted toxin-antitoxin system